jgi:hypothetical protein
MGQLKRESTPQLSHRIAVLVNMKAWPDDGL